MGVVGCAHDMDISGDFSISVNKDGFKFSMVRTSREQPCLTIFLH